MPADPTQFHPAPSRRRPAFAAPVLGAVAVALIALVAMPGCASRGPSYSVDYYELSAQLFIEDADGRLVSPLGGQSLSIGEDIGLGPDSIRLAPGPHRIRGIDCPLPSDEVLNAVVDGDPTAIAYSPPTHGFSLGHDFEIGKAYVLRCVDGYPEIVPYAPAGAPARLHMDAGEPRSILVDGNEVAVLDGGVDIAPGPHSLGGLCQATAPIVRRDADGDVVYIRSAASWTTEEKLESGRHYDVRCVELKLNGQSTQMPTLEKRE